MDLSLSRGALEWGTIEKYFIVDSSVQLECSSV